MNLSESYKNRIQELSGIEKTKITNINGDIFYHQTDCKNVESIKKNGFKTSLHTGQARFTHGVYFLNHPQGLYGNCTLQANLYGNFLDFRDPNDMLGDKWINFKDSYNYNNDIDLTEKIRKNYPNVDGLIFDNLLVVWYPEMSVQNIKEYNSRN